MKYTVIENFTDLQDNGHRYVVGDIYPRDGLVVSDKRLDELLTNKNRRNRPMIKLIEVPAEAKVEEPVETPAEILTAEDAEKASEKPEKDASATEVAETPSKQKKAKEKAKKG